MLPAGLGPGCFPGKFSCVILLPPSAYPAFTPLQSIELSLNHHDPGGRAPGCQPRASGSAHGSCCCFPGSPSQEAGFPVSSESRGLQKRLRGLPAGTCQGGCPPGLGEKPSRWKAIQVTPQMGSQAGFRGFGSYRCGVGSGICIPHKFPRGVDAAGRHHSQSPRVSVTLPEDVPYSELPLRGSQAPEGAVASFTTPYVRSHSHCSQLCPKQTRLTVCECICVSGVFSAQEK